MRSGRFAPTVRRSSEAMNVVRQIPGHALISPGRIGEPVGNDPGAARERRQNGVVEMVDPRGGKQQRLPRGAKSAREAGENCLAQRLGARRPSGFARANHRKPNRGEARLEPLGLHGLAHALAPLEGDEASSCLRGHGRRAISASTPIQSHRTKPKAGPSASGVSSSADGLFSMVPHELATSAISLRSASAKSAHRPSGGAVRGGAPLHRSVRVPREACDAGLAIGGGQSC